MDAQMIFRGIERLLIVGGAILSIFLGYRLFMHGITRGKASFSGNFSKLASFTFSGIGPGLFFMFFGIGVLGAALYFGSTETTTQTSSQPTDVSQPQTKPTSEASPLDSFVNKAEASTTDSSASTPPATAAGGGSSRQGILDVSSAGTSITTQKHNSYYEKGSPSSATGLGESGREGSPKGSTREYDPARQAKYPHGDVRKGWPHEPHGKDSVEPTKDQGGDGH